MWDREAKARLGYEHPKSRVWTDAAGNVVREVLHGADWNRRVEELRVRSGGQCEYMREIIGIAPWRCRNEAQDPCHIKARHPVRNDMLSNLLAGCRPCHIAHDEQGWRKTRFGERAA